MKYLNFLALSALMLLVPLTAYPASRTIYPDPTQARADLDAALKIAAHTHKRILLDFGGNWCPDCQVLDLYFHDPTNQPLLDANFILVDVNIGHMDANQDLARQYGIPLHKGVPALAVLSEKGLLLHSQQAGEFESMRNLRSSALTEFLLRWKR
jgi:thiol:disulfide interchange protein